MTSKFLTGPNVGLRLWNPSIFEFIFFKQNWTSWMITQSNQPSSQSTRANSFSVSFPSDDVLSVLPETVTLVIFTSLSSKTFVPSSSRSLRSILVSEVSFAVVLFLALQTPTLQPGQVQLVQALFGYFL